jgi:glucokinase
VHVLNLPAYAALVGAASVYPRTWPRLDGSRCAFGTLLGCLALASECRRLREGRGDLHVHPQHRLRPAGLPHMSLVVGIDAGGTKLAVGVVDPDGGRIVERREVPTRRHRGGQAVLEDCLLLVREVSRGRTIAAIGAGVPELVSLEGTIQTAENWDWRDGSFRPALVEIAPLYVESDVRAAALAEARFGAGRVLSSFLYLTIGTGVSHTFVVDGRPWRGARGNAIVTGAPPVELAASGAALARQARKRSGEEVFATPGDEPLVEAAAQALGTELAALVNALDPEGVVVGGGLGLAPGFVHRVTAHMRPQIYASATRDLAVHASGLGRHAGVIGAAVAAVDALRLASSLPRAPWAG